MDIMGLAQAVLGNLTSQGANSNALVNIAIRLVQYYPGGLPALLQQLQSSGLTDQVASWVSTGANQQVNGSQMQQAFGNQIQQVAQQANIPQGDVANGLASILPMLIDKLTPQGTLPTNHGEVDKALEMLKSKLAA
ncbi:MAG: DUF937 domain-containing protein [Alphaproteobacteria bacterium]|nr:DUF937 domain-containing protein [Alphaproteobacteria bacterium]